MAKRAAVKAKRTSRKAANGNGFGPGCLAEGARKAAVKAKRKGRKKANGNGFGPGCAKKKKATKKTKKK